MKTLQAVLIVLIIVAAVIGGYIILSPHTPAAEEQGGEGKIATTYSTTPITLQGSGATFPLLQIHEWIPKFEKDYPSTKVNYEGKGSGAGQSDFFNHLVDFAGSDPPLSHDKWLEYKGQVLQIPYLVGAVVVIYNVPDLGDHELRLTGEIVAKIYMGEIKYWDDPAIKRINSEIADLLPHKEIIAVYRSDSSGTTQIFTTFLAKRSSEWKEKVGVGKIVQWPVDEQGRGIGGKGNPGVAQAVQNTPYSIGYVEWAYAIHENLNIALIDNKAGNFVKPTKDSLQATVESVIDQLPGDPKDDWSNDLEIIVDAPGEDTYPIVAWTHFLVWAKYDDPAKAQAVKTWITWVLTEGRNSVLDGYAPIPESLANKLLKAVNNEVS